MSPKMIKQIIGAAAGVVIGLLMLLIGFFKTLLLVVLGLVGWWLCGSRTSPQPVKEFIDRVINYVTARHGGRSRRGRTAASAFVL